MTLVQKIAEDLKKSIKDKNEFRTSCLRLIKTALKNAQVEKRHELKDEEAQGVISSMIRKGEEAAAEFRRGKREDMALKEEREIKVLYEYLPEQLTAAEVERILRETI
ncbi:MAG: GatB/YqeY domain-containing protein, partial [Actinobacteria bacterium]|nr:GatB/YqeY domain-containing protein [Actinomycetota bacterium]